MKKSIISIFIIIFFIASSVVVIAQTDILSMFKEAEELYQEGKYKESINKLDDIQFHLLQKQYEGIEEIEGNWLDFKFDRDAYVGKILKFNCFFSDYNSEFMNKVYSMDKVDEAFKTINSEDYEFFLSSSNLYDKENTYHFHLDINRHILIPVNKKLYKKILSIKNKTSKYIKILYIGYIISEYDGD